MTRVLLIGNGAREHAIGLALYRSGVELFAHMERANPGIASICKGFTLGRIADPNSLRLSDDIDYAVVGPEAPLAAGVVDHLQHHGIPCVGPTQQLARIESSKSFARQLIDRAEPSANPRFYVVHDHDEMNRAIDELGVDSVVVKPDGLTGGKGVRLSGEHLKSREEIVAYADSLIRRDGQVVIEERLTGVEFTVQAFVSGTRLATMPLVRDYKRAYDNDTGPNTGSMGSYSREDHMLSYVTRADLERATTIMRRTIQQLREDTQTDYRGVLYGQFMQTENGIKVIEYNARFGDPEAINVLSIMKTSMDSVCQSIIDGDLKTAEFDRLATVCVYLVPEGYPGDDTVVDSPVFIGDDIDAEVFMASVYEAEGVIRTTTSRSLALLARGNSVAEARDRVYRDIKKISGRLRYRRDIAMNEK